MNKYKILWIDDEYERISELMNICEEMHGFEITKCRFAKEGMKIFERHLEEWSAVVLDAKVLMESLNEVPNLTGLRYCRDRINELKSRRYVPMFVFTGQPDLVSNDIFEGMVDKYYAKDDDDELLVENIISAADALFETQIIHKHQTVFDTWPESKHDLLRILKVLENEDWQNNSILNDIRKILSDIFFRCNERGFCTVEHDGSNIGACSKMMGQNYMQVLVPVYIQRSLHFCVDVTNPGSHRTETDSHVADGQAPYLIRSLIYEMLNILYWCRLLPSKENKNLVLAAIAQAKQKYEENKKNQQ